MDDILQYAARVRLLICDVDGVFTDGTLYLGENAQEYKPFHIHDGLGIKLLLASGVDVAVITSRSSEIVQNRMTALGIKYIHQGQEDKMQAYESLLKQMQLTDAEVAYIGDDLPDLPLIRRAGLGVTVANGVALVKQHAKWQTRAEGGRGAVREICELIMTAQNTLGRAHEKYLVS
jgi:3-deoxy-D-manno-octulosonate 8-phosphate phosphatase (KDO 8-P phosphatase)